MTGFRNLLNGIFHDASLSKSYSIGADKAGFVRGVFGSPQHSQKINVDTKLKFISYMDARRERWDVFQLEDIL